MKKHALVVLSLVGILSVMAPALSADAAWKSDANGRYYTTNNDKGYVTGWKKIGKYKYYFAKNKYAATGWKYIENNWYFFSAKGRMVTKRWVDGFYLTKSGKMAINTIVDGVKVDQHGNRIEVGDSSETADAPETKPVSTWVEKSGKKYYYDYQGKLAKGYLTIKDETYYMDPTTGAMRTGVVKIGKKYYYFDTATGIQKTGWVNHNNKTYYFRPSKKYAATKWAKISKQHYYFSKKGVLQKNAWIDDRTYHTNANGIRQTGWVTLSKHTYYFNEAGKISIGHVQIDGHYYYFSKKGRLQKNKWVGGKYFQADGKMATKKWIETKYVGANGTVTKTRQIGFFTKKSNTYYRDPNTFKLIKNTWYKIDTNWYYFNSTGVLQKNTWINDTRYVTNTGAMVVNSFKKINGSYYLFDTSGFVMKGLKNFKGLTYYLDPTTGARKTGWIVLNDVTYYFQPGKSGAMAVDVTLSISGITYTFDKTGASNYESINASRGRSIAEYAKKFVGYPYVYGGATDLTKGVDCSGFTMLVFKYFGLNIPRVAAAQALGTSAYGGPFAPAKFISESDLMPGDIICYYSPVSHVGIYIGDGKIVHASNSAPYPQGGIKISAYNYTKITKIVRYW